MEIAENVIARFFKERFFDQAAQTAYYLLLSMFPFLLFILSLLSLFPVHEEMLLTFLRPFAPEQSFTLIEMNIHTLLAKGHGKVLYASLGAAFWVSSIAVQSLARSLDLANGNVRRYAFWKVLIRDLGYHTSFYACHPALIASPDYRKCVAEGNYVL